MWNALKTFMLLTAMTMLLMLIGARLGGNQGMILAFGLAVLLNFSSYWFSDKIVLAMYKARDPQPREQAVVDLVEELAQRADLPVPKVKVIDTTMCNAFATGRNPQHAVVAVTTGILGILNREELAAVLAHELSHVRHRDILIGAVAATMAGAIAMLGRLAFFFGGGRDRDNILVSLVMMILAPIAALLIQMAISRSREFEADRGSARLTKDPEALVRALEKLHQQAGRHPVLATGQQSATAHLFIVNPFKAGWLTSLFSTHPSLEQRVANLRDMARQV